MGVSVLAKCCFSFHYDIKWLPECNLHLFCRTWTQYLTTADETSDCDDGLAILSSVLWFLLYKLKSLLFVLTCYGNLYAWLLQTAWNHMLPSVVMINRCCSLFLSGWILVEFFKCHSCHKVIIQSELSLMSILLEVLGLFYPHLKADNISSSYLSQALWINNRRVSDNQWAWGN